MQDVLTQGSLSTTGHKVKALVLKHPALHASTYVRYVICLEAPLLLVTPGLWVVKVSCVIAEVQEPRVH